MAHFRLRAVGDVGKQSGASDQCRLICRPEGGGGSYAPQGETAKPDGVMRRHSTDQDYFTNKLYSVGKSNHHAVATSHHLAANDDHVPDAHYSKINLVNTLVSNESQGWDVRTGIICLVIVAVQATLPFTYHVFLKSINMSFQNVQNHLLFRQKVDTDRILTDDVRARVWNGLDQSAGFIIQFSPGGFGLDWIRNLPT